MARKCYTSQELLALNGGNSRCLCTNTVRNGNKCALGINLANNSQPLSFREPHKQAPSYTAYPYSSLKIMYCNARSFPKHSLEIWSLLDSDKPDVLFMTETWLHDSATPDNNIALPLDY